MRKKTIAALLAVLLLVSLLAGCGDQGAASSGPQQSGTSAAATDAPKPDVSGSGTDAPDDSNASFYPVADEPVSLTGWGAIPPSMLSHIKDESLSNIGNLALAQEATNVYVDWRAVSLDDGTSLLGITLASGDVPDILTLVERFYAGGRSKILSDNICIDVLQYAPEWAPDWYKFYSETPNYSSTITSTDGKVVQMFGYKNYIDNGTVIRKDWLDQLQLEVPETYDELTKVLEAFVIELGAEYAAGVKANGTIGNHVTTWSTGGYGVIGSLIQDNQLPWQVDENGKAQMCYAMDGYYEYSKMLNDWYNKGIISDEFMQHDSYNDENLLEGKCGYGYANVSLLADSVTETHGITFEAIPEITKNKGDTVKTGGITEGVSNFGAAISAECQQVEYALKYLNWFWSEEGAKASNFGIEDTTYYYDESGEMHWSDLIVNNPDGLNLKLAQYVYCGYVSMGYPMDYAMLSMSFTNDRQREAASLWTSNRTNEYEYYGVMTAEEQAVYDSYLADMCTFISEKYVGYITGNEPLENFEANVEQLYSMGLQEMMDAKQAAYDRYMGK